MIAITLQELLIKLPQVNEHMRYPTKPHHVQGVYKVLCAIHAAPGDTHTHQAFIRFTELDDCTLEA